MIQSWYKLLTHFDNVSSLSDKSSSPSHICFIFSKYCYFCSLACCFVSLFINNFCCIIKPVLYCFVSSQGTWNDQECEDRNPYICKQMKQDLGPTQFPITPNGCDSVSFSISSLRIHIQRHITGQHLLLDVTYCLCLYTGLGCI